jgi:hypothetical protein
MKGSVTDFTEKLTHNQEIGYQQNIHYGSSYTNKYKIAYPRVGFALAFAHNDNLIGWIVILTEAQRREGSRPIMVFSPRFFAFWANDKRRLPMYMP